MHFDLLNPELTEPDDEQLCEPEELLSHSDSCFPYCCLVLLFMHTEIGGSSGVIKRYNP